MRSNDSQKIIVVGIPKTLDDTGLSEMFGTFGAVADAKVVIDANTKQSRGFGFVTFTTSNSMRKAIRDMNQKKIDGRVLNVRQLQQKDAYKESKAMTSITKRPCWLLRKGKCKKGAACEFAHDAKDGDFGSCFEFAQTGTCKRGDKCIFTHGIVSISETNEDNSEKSEETNITSKTSAKRVCYSYQKGRCHRGKSCLFAHELLSQNIEVLKSTTNVSSNSIEQTNEIPKDQPIRQDKKRSIHSVKDEINLENNTTRLKKRQKTEDKQVSSNDEEVPQPLHLLAAHVSAFMEKKNMQKDQLTHESMPQTPKTNQKASKAKNKAIHNINNGDEFNSSEVEVSNKRPIQPKSSIKENTQKERLRIKQIRQKNRTLKKEALSRLKQQGPIELS